MAKFELSITVKYLPEWGVWEGVRELIQNGKDAEVEHSAPLTVDWRNGTLRIENEGAVLSREALLFGTTSKGGRADLIGKFGEGLKLGMLALVRAGRSVKVRTGSEVWTPSIARSEKYGNADVLVVDIKDGNEEKRRVRVEIGGVTESDWLAFRARFLFLRDGRESDKNVVKTSDGDLLIGDKYAGKLYVKGIFVMQSPNLRYGYNYRDAELDRDRNMIESYDRKRKMAYILNAAVSVRPDLVNPYLDMLEDLDCEECQGITPWALPESLVIDAAVSRFVARYGSNAVPCRTMAECADIEHYGMRGVVVTEATAVILKGTLGNAETTKVRFAKAVTKQYSFADLTDVERANLTSALALMSNAGLTATLVRVDVVDYQDPDLNGLHHGARVSVARKLLVTERDVLCVLVHEFAHDAGNDGDKSHVAAIEASWSAIVAHLRR